MRITILHSDELVCASLPSSSYKWTPIPCCSKNHVTVHKDISTAVFNLGDKIYRYYYITVFNDMDWLPYLRELSNHFCFDYFGSLIMNHKYIGNEDAGRVNVYFYRGKASHQCQKRQKEFFGLYVSYDRRVKHQLTE